MEFHRAVTTRTSAADAFAYLADFTTTTEWEPGTVTTTLESGDGGVGTTYRNVSRFLGRETELTYIVVERVSNSLIKLRGHNKTVTVEDTMTFTSLPSGGTEVTYRAGFAFHGAARLLTPVLAVALRRLVDSAADALREVLDELPA
jgi:hypothetical protein